MDELTSGTAETPASGTPPTGQAPQTSQESPTTPQPQSEPAQSNGGSIPSGYVREEDFRGLQRQLSQTLSNTQRQAQAQIAQMQAQLQEAQMAGMDDLEKAQFRAQQLEAYVQQRDAQDEYQTLLQMRATKIYETANRFGVPVEVIQNAQSPDEMYEAAIAYKDQQVDLLATKRAAEIKQLQEHEKVDLGSGSYSNPREQRLAAAVKAKDTTAYYAALLAEN